MVMGEIGLTPRGKRVIELAVDEARRLDHHYIGAEHLLLGLIREGEGIAAGVLESLGVSLEKVRAEVLKVVQSSNDLDAAQSERGQESSTEQGRASEGDGIVLGDSLQALNDMLDTLTQRELKILLMRYGLIDGRPRTLEAVSKALGITREHIRQIETQILRKLHSNNLHHTLVEAILMKDTTENTGSAEPEHVALLFDFTIWARDQLLGVIEKLDDDALRKAPESGAYGSIYDTLAHMAVSEWMWTRRCLGESPTRLPTSEDFVSLRALIDWWNQIHADATTYLSDLSDADLEQEVSYRGPDGKTRTRKVWHMLLQTVNHQTEHRSQVSGMLGQMGLEVPQTDLVVYLSQQ